jgi:hypothetical protein
MDQKLKEQMCDKIIGPPKLTANLVGGFIGILIGMKLLVQNEPKA